MKYNINASLVQHISSGTEGVLQANRDRQSNKETAINKHFLFFALFFYGSLRVPLLPSIFYNEVERRIWTLFRKILKIFG